MGKKSTPPTSPAKRVGAAAQRSKKFKLVPGVPAFKELWDNLVRGRQQGTLTPEEDDFTQKLSKAMGHLQVDPQHPGLNSHEITALTRRFGHKVFESYLENNTPSAGRVFWAYGPRRGMITILAVESHPEDAKRGAYDRVKLSRFPGE